MPRPYRVACRILLSVLLPVALAAETLTFRGEASWDSWDRPHGLTQIGDAGQLQLVRFRKDIDAVRDAHLFSYESKTRGLVNGGLWEALSNPADAPLVIDGDPTTFWQPDPADSEEEWAIEIDLGRAVLAREIRLSFPDEDGARPLRQFTVYVSTGTRIAVDDDLYLYAPVFRTIKPNTQTSLSIPLSYTVKDSSLVIDEGLDVDLERVNQHRMVHRVRILAEEQSPDAALAEIEVIAVGDNISLGTLQRGSLINGEGAQGPDALFDADMNTNSNMPGGRGDQNWLTAGIWFGVDLGAVFFIDELFIYAFSADEGLLGFLVNGLTGSGHQILVSDGTPTDRTSLPVPEPLDYEPLLTHDRPNLDNLAYLRYVFKPRKVRHLFWRGLHIDGWGWATKWAELMLFSPGYPAELTLRSGFIDLGDVAGDQRPKVIKSLSWDAATPAGTSLRLRSRSGNTLGETYDFHDRAGNPVTEAKWSSAPKVLRGRVDTTVVAGDDWGPWSNTYLFSGEAFKSDSPRRFIQLEMIMATDDPQTAAAVNSLSIDFEDALIQGARGRILPQQTQPNEDTRFTYTLLPRSGVDDSGFDILRLAVPDAVTPESVAIRVGGQDVAAAVSVDNDSLQVTLPQMVKGDSIEVSFTTRVVRNATVFGLDLGSSSRPGLWQSVEPDARRSDVVLLPALTDSRELIGDLTVPTAFTPNGDGINDALEVAFVPFKVEDARPTVAVYDLAGRQRAHLTQTAAGARQRYAWDGRDQNGGLVPPGLYLLRIDLGAAAGDDTATRLVTVSY